MLVQEVLLLELVETDIFLEFSGRMVLLYCKLLVVEEELWLAPEHNMVAAMDPAQQHQEQEL